MKASTRTAPVILAAVLITGYLVGSTTLDARANLPANRVGVAASTLEKLAVQTNQGQQSTTVTLLSSTFRSSNLIDLEIHFSAECALFTDVKTVNTGTSNDTSQAIATVQSWIEIDGNPVPVTQNAGNGKPDDGRIVFCNRDHKLNTVFKDDTNDDSITIADYIHSREANAFNWMALNVPAGVHTLTVRATLTANVTTPNGMAKALIGKRTLIVNPEHLAPDATF
ncbi:MAG: hypothetical protein NVSMB57_08090 [Actinomycetota bacterium]